MDRTGTVGTDEFFELAADGCHVRARLGSIYVIFPPDQAYGFPFGDVLQGKVRHQGGSGVKVQDAIGIDDQSTVTIRVQTKVDTTFFILIDAIIVIQPGLRLPYGGLFSAEVF